MPVILFAFPTAAYSDWSLSDSQFQQKYQWLHVVPQYPVQHLMAACLNIWCQVSRYCLSVDKFDDDAQSPKEQSLLPSSFPFPPSVSPRTFSFWVCSIWHWPLRRYTPESLWAGDHAAMPNGVSRNNPPWLAAKLVLLWTQQICPVSWHHTYGSSRTRLAISAWHLHWVYHIHSWLLRTEWMYLGGPLMNSLMTKWSMGGVLLGQDTLATSTYIWRYVHIYTHIYVHIDTYTHYDIHVYLCIL